MFYIAYKQFNGETFVVNSISDDGHINLIPLEQLTDISQIKTQWDKASIGKELLKNKKYNFISIKLAQERLKERKDFKKIKN